MRRFSQKGIISNIVAGVLVLCMFVVDMGLLGKLETKSVQYEEHELEEAYADGDYKDSNSNYAHDREGDVTSVIDKTVVNVLEIVPSEGLAQVGYTVAGCEPLGDTDEMREAILDGLFNMCPGSANEQYNNWPKLNDLAMNNNNSFKAMGYTEKEYPGCYKYVGNGNGVYSLGTMSDAVKYKDGYVDDVIMISKYYDNYKEQSTKKNDYIWIYGDSNQSRKTTKEQLESNGDIYISHNYRKKYFNNEEFLSVLYSDSTTTSARGVGGVDGVKGIYDFKKNGDQLTNFVTVANGNYDKIAEWRKTHDVNVVTRTPKTLKDEDISTADIIIMCACESDGSYNKSLDIYNLVNGTSVTKDQFSASNDITWNQVIEIYERVVIKQDVAFLASENCSAGNNFDTNIRKLMCMLFFIIDNHTYDAGNDPDRMGSGREMFMDFMKKYVDDSRYIDLRRSDERYVAPSLRGGKHYMYGNDPDGYEGFPYYLNPNDTIVGYNEETNEPIYYSPDGGIPYRERIMRVQNESDFTNDGISKRSDDNPDGYWVDDYYGVDYAINIRATNNESEPTICVERTNFDLKACTYKKEDTIVKIDISGSDGDYTVNCAIGDESFEDHIHKDGDGKKITIKPITGEGFVWDNKTYARLEVNNNSDIPVKVYTEYYEPRFNLNSSSGDVEARHDDRFKYCVKMYASRSNTTDFVYIDDDGNLIFDPKYSNKWYNADHNINKGAWEDKRVSWEKKSSKNPYTKWPSSFVIDWWFGETDKGPNDHIPVYFQYSGWGTYSFKNSIGTGNYRNQSVFSESYTLFKYGDGGQGSLVSMSTDKNVKNEAEHHVHEVTGTKKYYASMNVTNGDSYSGKGNNKIIYVNRYELGEPEHLGIPLVFEIGSSEEIVKIELFKDGISTPILTYTRADTNSIKDESMPDLKYKVDSPTTSSEKFSELTLKNITKYDAVTKEPEMTEAGTPKYYCKGIIDPGILKDHYSVGINNKFKFRVTIDIGSPNESIQDEITVVVRDFFELN